MQEIANIVQRLRKNEQVQRWTILLVIFALALLPRAIHPVSRPMHWYSRAVRFSDAMLAGDWANTYQRYHPGVPTMWLAGIGLKVFAAWHDLSSEQLLDAVPVKPGVVAEAVEAGVLPLALIIALCIALSYILLSRLVGRRMGFVAACLLALDPFYITYSRVLHVDALLTTFMLVSALFLLSYLQRDERRDLVSSGVFGGLALLTKSPAIFLIPYAGLAAGVYGLVLRRSEETGNAGWRGWAEWLWGMSRTLVAWMLTAAVVFVVVWPAMWVRPGYALSQIVEHIIFHAETPHRNPVFFNGQATFADVGPMFYLAIIGWKTTLLTLPMIVAGIVFAALRPGREKRNVVVWLFVAYAFFFIAQMCFGARKELRYLVPIFPALDVVAAFGVVCVAETLGRMRRWQEWRWLLSAIVGAALALQAGLVLPRHPYYGTLHNRLLGGSQAAQHVIPFQDQAEGLDLAGKYLNTLPRAQRAGACVHERASLTFKRYFIGLTSVVPDPQANYRIYFINQVMRQFEKWKPFWEADFQTEPLWTVEFDGVTYVWVYGAPPEEPAAGGPEHKVDYQLGEHIQLERVRLNAETIAPGDTLTVVPIWKSDGNIKKNYKVFCHLMSEDGELVAQRDGIPLYSIRPTPSWRAGEIIEDSYEIPLDGDLVPGTYELFVGMYDAESMERLPIYDAAGKRVSDDRIRSGSVRVEATEE